MTTFKDDNFPLYYFTDIGRILLRETMKEVVMIGDKYLIENRFGERIIVTTYEVRIKVIFLENRYVFREPLHSNSDYVVDGGLHVYHKDEPLKAILYDTNFKMVLDGKEIDVLEEYYRNIKVKTSYVKNINDYRFLSLLSNFKTIDIQFKNHMFNKLTVGYIHKIIPHVNLIFISDIFKEEYVTDGIRVWNRKDGKLVLPNSRNKYEMTIRYQYKNQFEKVEQKLSDLLSDKTKHILGTI